MDENSFELLEKLRQQFDAAPYPNKPLEQFPESDGAWLYIHNMVTPYYLRNQKVIDTEEKFILDAGCGTGYKSLALAQANPGAKIIGIDLSEVSVNLARQRLQYYGFNNTEFYVISIEELKQLSLQFDYINCDEVLYILPNPSQGLNTLSQALKPDGVMRVNLHSSLQRNFFFRGQNAFRMMGLMDDNPGELEVDLVREIMKSLRDQIMLKKITWNSNYEEDNQAVIIDYLLQGDKGYTIPKVFSLLKTAELEFISMVNRQQWNLMDLFKDPDNLPLSLRKILLTTSIEERLHLFELLHPMHRLIDFWCGHPAPVQAFSAIADWADSAWQQAKVHLHPQLRTSAIREELTCCIEQLKPFELSQLLPIAGERTTIDSTIAACLLPLWEQSELMSSLLERWRTLRPVYPVSLKPTTREEAFEVIKQALMKLHKIGYVLLEC
jgi:2-polyprenyl-3-methyl-5-hydroxy-6-metoxy-1,4-benzoquinol methylase